VAPHRHGNPLGGIAMRRQQRGITAISFLIIAAMVAAIGYAGVRLIPIYLNQMKVQQLLNDLKSEYDGQNVTPSALQSAIGRRLDIEMLDFPSVGDFRIEKVGNGYRVSVAYEDRVPYAANLSLVAEFDNSVEIRR
jgi:hypothetical protein